MVVYYTQILNRDSKKILTGDFSANGSSFKEDKRLLLELKQVMTNASFNEEKLYTFNSKSGNFIFYFVLSNKLIISAIADNRATPKDISKYIDEVVKEFTGSYQDFSTTHYEFDDKLKELSDIFNKRSKFLKGAAELEDAHSVLVENLDSLINRGENINNLKDLAEKVSFETKEMSRKVTRMKRNAQIEQYKIYGVCAIIIIILLYFLFFR